MRAASPPLLIVPGLHGSGPTHWQSWLQSQWPDATRAEGLAWDQPVLAQWALHIRDLLAKAPQPVWLVAHSFGCLASVVAVADRPEQVAQLVLVAPASPDRFDCMDLRPDRDGLDDRFSLRHAVPLRPLQVNGLLIASRNDPWQSFEEAAALTAHWQLDLHDAGSAGHINPDSGYGPWPALLALLRQRLRQRPQPLAANAALRKGRGSALAAVRQLTREQMQSPHDHRLWQ